MDLLMFTLTLMNSDIRFVNVNLSAVKSWIYVERIVVLDLFYRNKNRKYILPHHYFLNCISSSLCFIVRNHIIILSSKKTTN